MFSKIKFQIYSWIGRHIYSLRLTLEELQYYVDRKAGEHLKEE